MRAQLVLGPHDRTGRRAFSLMELIAVIAILGVLATMIIQRVTPPYDGAEIAACLVYKAEIEIQAELWRHNTGNWPAANLATIGADVSYFPGGLPTCPVDESAYTIDTSTGLVIGHNH